ncbi:juvenile hormone acid O-methyltransferase-like [Bradysia coprophila]|uniref:juvenile hormone acid O-methyltransferase-like n=1 Tax=Bradysia coprophila TaxID=38358 RepID=UPI00187DCAE6|nr:juvenile hormone acid O-methyltransferase-like [Bradysia coprophila]
MNKPLLFRESSKVTEHYSREALKEFPNVFKGISDGNESWLDAGCGPGNVTLNVLLPMLPENFKRLVGVDVSKEMVTYAREAAAHPKVSYELLNLDVELEKQSFNETEAFDHVVSFFCLMYIKNQNVCIANFNKLLKAGGDVLIAFLVKHPMYDAYEHLAKSSRWGEYMKDVDRQITPYLHSTKAKEEFQLLLETGGFTELDVRVQDSLYVFEDVNTLRDLLHSVNPFIDRIPAHDKQAFLDDMIGYFVQAGYALGEKDGKASGFKLPYRMMVAYGKKASIQLN